MTFVHAELVHLVWPAAALVALLAWLELRGGDLLARFVSAVMQLRLAERPSRARRAVRVALCGLALGAGIVALMRPQTAGGTESVAPGRVSADVMVVLDVSKSMLAEDAAPSRLQRAKADVQELAERLDGHRLGLVAFAGRAVVLCPLTPDADFFRMVLRGAGVGSVARGGTRIGEGIRAALAAFGDGGGSRLILLITDGEDHESYPLDAAKEAAAAGVRIVAIGFGDEKGSEILVSDPETGVRKVLTDRGGQVVRSRLDGELLRQLALATDGAFVPAGTAALDLSGIVAEHIEPLAREAAGISAVRRVPTEHYPWFVLGALSAICGAAWAGVTPAARPR